jgi:D-amino-acid dehydrogenase
MHVCVVGAGVVGLTTAYMLVRKGHNVTLIDRAHSVGLGTSYANGAQLSYSYVAPLASRELLAKLPFLFLSPSSPMKLRVRQDRSVVSWALAFLRECNDRSVSVSTAALLALAAHSKEMLEMVAGECKLKFGFREAGKLVLYRSERSFVSARKQAELQASIVGDNDQQVVLSAEECLEKEPTLLLQRKDLAGGIYTTTEQVGDCHAFCDALFGKLQANTRFASQLGVQMRSTIMHNNTITAIHTSQGDIVADAYVLANGTAAAAFARQINLDVKIYPLKGYSITARRALDTVPLKHSITDFDRKIVFAPLQRELGQVIRVAGIADLDGHTDALNRRRLTQLVSQTRDVIALDLEADYQPWVGLRPATPDSRPILGASSIKNLFLNVGHGALGWTLACGSASVVAEAIDGNSIASLQRNWFSLNRE